MNTIVAAFCLLTASSTVFAGPSSHSKEGPKVGPTIIVSHYISSFQVRKDGRQVLIDTEIKLVTPSINDLASECKNLSDHVQASLTSIEEELLADSIFTINQQTSVLPSGIKKSKNICTLEITSKNSEVRFAKMKTSLLQRAGSENLDEVDPNVLKTIGELRKDPFVVNYFQAKHTYIAFKSFVEYLKVVPK